MLESENAHIGLLIPGDQGQAFTLLNKIAAYALSLGHDIRVLEVALDVNQSASCSPMWLAVYDADSILAYAAQPVLL